MTKDSHNEHEVWRTCKSAHIVVSGETATPSDLKSREDMACPSYADHAMGGRAGDERNGQMCKVRCAKRSSEIPRKTRGHLCPMRACRAVEDLRCELDAPFAAQSMLSILGSIGRNAPAACRRYGYATNIGGKYIAQRHDGCRDCPACVRMQAMYGTCEYVGETHRCECPQRRSRERLFQRRRGTRQTVLQSDSTERTRVRYWFDYLRQQRELIAAEEAKSKKNGKN